MDDSNINWVKTGGPRKNPNTGPDTDHTEQTYSGIFDLANMKAFKEGDKASIYSQSHPQTTYPQCVTFW